MKKKQKPVALFIPCYNEEKRLKVKEFLVFIRNNSKRFDFYFIDDGSKDDTSKIIRDNIVDNANVFLITLPENLGKGKALRLGFLENQQKPYKYYGFIDADLDIPLDQINRLYSQIEDSKYFITTSKRNLMEEISIFRLRSFSSIVMILVANKLIGFDPKLQDTQCGCKLFKKEIIYLCFGKEFISEWLFDIEIFMRLKNNLPNSRELIKEVPVTHINKSGISNYKFSQNIKVFKQLFNIYSRYSNEK